MFKSAGNTRSLITLFHNPTSSISKNLVSIIKTKYENPATRSFDIEITESKPTHEQFKSLNSFYRQQLDEKEPIRPILVDWFNGKVAVNDEQSSIKILQDALNSSSSNNK